MSLHARGTAPPMAYPERSMTSPTRPAPCRRIARRGVGVLDDVPNDGYDRDAHRLDVLLVVASGRSLDAQFEPHEERAPARMHLRLRDIRQQIPEPLRPQELRQIHLE